MGKKRTIEMGEAGGQRGVEKIGGRFGVGVNVFW